MMQRRSLFASASFVIFLLAVDAEAFVSHPRSSVLPVSSTSHGRTRSSSRAPFPSGSPLRIRGGGESSALPSVSAAAATAMETLRTTLLSGSSVGGIATLLAAASVVVVPLTLIRQAYSFSVGYGLSVASMASALLYTFVLAGGAEHVSVSTFSSPPAALALVALAYGLRLSSYLLVRELTVPSKKESVKSFDKSPRLKRIPLALGVSVLYAFMTSPVLFALRSPAAATTVAGTVQACGAAAAAAGMLLESLADQHKYLFKRSENKDGGDDASFAGPTTWSYAIIRHPNYLGEMLFWSGLFVSGAASFGRSVAAWACGGLGLWGILGIMLGASSRLDGKQDEKYGGQAAYDGWKEKVPYSVIPFLK